MTFSERGIIKFWCWVNRGCSDRMLSLDFHFPVTLNLESCGREADRSLLWRDLKTQTVPELQTVVVRPHPSVSFHWYSWVLRKRRASTENWQEKNNDIVLALEQLRAQWKRILPSTISEKYDTALGLEETSGRWGLTFKAWLEVDEAKGPAERTGTKNE